MQSRPAALASYKAWTGAAAILYEEVLMGAYGGNCEEFYANEIRPRLHLSDGES